MTVYCPSVWYSRHDTGPGRCLALSPSRSTARGCACLLVHVGVGMAAHVNRSTWDMGAADVTVSVSILLVLFMRVMQSQYQFYILDFSKSLIPFIITILYICMTIILLAEHRRGGVRATTETGYNTSLSEFFFRCHKTACGVPPGCTTIPLLFLVHMNDIANYY